MDVANTPSAAERQARLAARLQLPRRVVLLLVAFGLAVGLILAVRAALPGGASSRAAAMLAERLPASLLLLAAASVLAAVQAAVLTAVAVGIHHLEARAGPVGSIVKGLDRLWVFGQAAMPVAALAALALLIFAFQLRLLPAAAGRAGPASYLLPALCLALLPAVLAAQAAARELTLPGPQAGLRFWLGGLLTGFAALAGQTSGLLSSLLLVEMAFAFPGVGRLFFEGLMLFDVSVSANVLIAFAALALLGRLAAELFRWLRRLFGVPAPAPLPETPTPWRVTARKIWVGASLALLLLPLGLAVLGLTVGGDALTQVNPAARSAGPSSEHLLGTDSLGRDVWARTLRGSLQAVSLALGAAIPLALFSAGAALLSNRLARRGTLVAESLADLLGLPGDVLLLLPALPAAVLFLLPFGPGSPLRIMAFSIVLLLPRVTNFCRSLWAAAPAGRPAASRLLPAAGAVWLISAFAAVWLLSAVDFLGMGPPPPVPTLGASLNDGLRGAAQQPWGVAGPALALGLISFAFYTAAHALAGYFASREPFARVNE